MLFSRSMLYNEDMNKRLFSLAGGAAIMAVGIFAVATSAFAAVPSVVSIKLTGPNVITVVYSEPVQTNTWDYTNFTGDLAGFGVVSISGSGSNVITLTLSGNPVISTGSSGYLTIGSGVTSISTQSPFPGGSYNVTSAQAPILSSVSLAVQNIGSTFSALGSQITLTFSTNESVVNPTVTLLGHTIGVNGTGQGPYTVNYTVASGDAQGTIPATITFTDTNGNTGTATVNVLSNGAATTNGTASIVSNANSSGVLYPGSTITFTLTPATPEPSARSVTGSYNGVPLSWYTTNNGVTYTAIYTVANGQGNTNYPVQISGVTLIDQYGNTLGPFSGSDVQKTITATGSTSPISIYQANAVPSTGAATNPSYGFVSTEPGAISYGGDCSSQTTSASAGLNTIYFNTLAAGTHSNCTIRVTDSSGNMSNQLVVSPFTVGAAVATPASTSATNSVTSQLQALEAQLAQLQSQTNGGTGTAATSLYDFTTFLGVGSTGAAVTALQRQLTADGFYAGPITGTYGLLTEAAVEKFQSAHGISPKGYVGPGTRAALNAGE
jgi:hypothetical protein